VDWIEIRRAVGVKVRVKIKSKSKATDANVRSTWGNATSKQRGELAEMMFMVKAAQKGFATAKPYGDSRRYDFILDVGRCRRTLEDQGPTYSPAAQAQGRLCLSGSLPRFAIC
jgi:hypothetical protein